MTDSLLTKYRPVKFSEVVGQEAMVRSLAAALKRQAGRCYLFIGPSGVGKTTLARIAASEVGCGGFDLTEIDAASYSGKDDMKDICQRLAYVPIGGKSKAVIIDECQSLSKAAWESLLKTLEHPPAHAYWFLCTTEPNKVPKAALTRSLKYELKLVDRDKLTELLFKILTAENIELGDEKDEAGIVQLCVKEAYGSPRQAIANLAICLAAKTRKDAAELLASADETTEAIEFVRALYDGADWERLRTLINGLGNVNSESVRQVVRAYGEKIVLTNNNRRLQDRAMRVLSCFSAPFYNEGKTPILLACARLLGDSYE